VGVTIGTALSWADKFCTLPRAADALTLVAIALHLLTFLVRAATVMTWAVVWADTVASGLIEDVTLHADATSVTVFDLHWDSVQMHI